jgi:hypothetical protein
MMNVKKNVAAHLALIIVVSTSEIARRPNLVTFCISNALTIKLLAVETYMRVVSQQG